MLSENINLYLVAFFALLVMLLLLPYLPYLIVVILIAGFFLLYKGEFLLFLIIILFTSLTRYTFSDLRAYVNIISTSALFFYFIKQYGLKFSEYPKIPAGLLIFVSIVIFTFSISTIVSSSFFTSFRFLLLTIIFFPICYIFYSFIKGKKTIYLYIFAIITTEFIVSLSIYSEFLKAGLDFHLNNGVLARFAGFLGNPNVVGLTAFIATCLILSLFFIPKFSSRKYRVLLSLLLINSALTFLIVDSRAAIIALIVGSSFILFVLKRKLLLRILQIVLPILLILFAIPVIRDSFFILLRLSDAGSRNPIWQAGLSIFSSHMLFGVGLGTYPQHVFTYFSSSEILKMKLMGELFAGRPNPHNFILLLACENGLLGLITGIFSFTLFFYMAYKCLKGYKNLDREFYVFSVVITGIGLGALERSFFEVSGISYNYITQDLPFWLIFFILAYMYKKLKEIKPSDNRKILA